MYSDSDVAKQLRPKEGRVKRPGGGSGYTSRRRLLEAQLDTLEQEAARAEQELALSRQREVVLFDFIMHQDQILSLFSQLQLSACSSQQAAQLPDEAAAATAAGAEADIVSDNGHQQQRKQRQPQQRKQRQPQQGPWASNSYMDQLLQTADMAHIQRALTMTAADWSEFFTASFHKLLLLLELASRGSEDTCQGNFGLLRQGHNQQPAVPGICSQAGTQWLPKQQQQQQQSTDTAIGHIPSAASSVVCGSSDSGDYGVVQSAGSPLAQLEWLVDDWVRLTALALIYNPSQIYLASTINHATQCTLTPPPDHWVRVVRRMGITRQQSLLFGSAVRVMAALDAGMVARGGPLAASAGCPSVMVLAAEAQRSAAAAVAAAATGTASCAEPPVPAALAAGSAAPAGCGGRQQAAFSRRARGRSKLAPPAGADATADTATNPPGGPASSCGGGDAGCGRDGLESPVETQLVRNVGRMPLHGMLLLGFNCNTLTRLQLAKCLVASYPFLPMGGMVAAEAARLQQQLGEPGGCRHCNGGCRDELVFGEFEGGNKALQVQQMQELLARHTALQRQMQQWWLMVEEQTIAGWGVAQQ